MSKNKKIDSLDIALLAEKFYRKNKKILYMFLIICLLLIIAFKYNSYKKHVDLVESNKIYTNLISNSSTNLSQDESKLKSLNKSLYDVYLVNKSIKSEDIKKMVNAKDNIDSKFYKDLVNYQIASTSQKETLLKNSFELKFIGDLSKVLLSYIYVNNNDIASAKSTIAMLSTKSPVYNLSKIMQHYSINNGQNK